MSSTIPQLDERKEFLPGTTGWTADDLDDPEIERLWNAGSYEIVEGVLTVMPPANLDSGFSLQALLFMIQLHVRDHSLGGKFAPEADLIVSGRRVARSDAAYLNSDDLRRQEDANRQRRKGKFKYGRLRVPPTLVIESLSLGHESHDRETKLNWYAEFGVRNYWILDAQRRSLECLVLEGRAYRVDVEGKGSDVLRPSLFSGLVIPLAELWA